MSINTAKLAGKNVLLLGGTSGIGFAAAHKVLQEGAHITISSSSEEKIAKAVERLQTSFPQHASRIRSYAADLSNKENLDATIEGILKFTAQKATIDHIVFTAGNVPHMPPLTEASFDDVDAFLVVRFYGAMAIGKHAHKYVTASKTSSITLTTGSQTRKPQSWLPPAVGCMVEGLMRGLAVTLAPVRVNAVAPGFIITELIQRLPTEMAQGAIEKYKAQSLTKDNGYPDDTAEAYLYFMKDTYVTGTVLNTNGGVFFG